MKMQPHSQFQLHEEKIRANEEQLNQIFNATNDILFMLAVEPGEKFRFISVNKSFYKATGIPKEKVIDRYANEVIPAESYALVIKKYKEAITNASTVQWEETSVYPTGTKTGIISITPVYNADNICTHLVGSVHDITERKLAEEKIRRSNERFEMIGNATNDAIWEWNLETNELWANEMHQKLYGLTTADPVPPVTEWINRMHPDDREKTVNAQNKVLASDRNVWTSKYRFKTGEGYQDIYDRCYIVRDASGKAVRLMGSMMNITGLKKAEAELRKLNDKYSTLMDNVDGIVWEADAKTFEFNFVSKQAERLLGYPVEQWLNEPNFWADHIYEEDRNWAVNYCIQCTAEKKSHEFEYRMVAADGRIIWLRDIVAVQVINDEAVSLRGIMVDITERKEAEEELKMSEQRYRSLIEQASDPIMITDQNGNFLDVNSTLCELFGYKKEELLQLNIRNIVDRDQLAEKPIRFDLLIKGEHVFSQRRMIHKNGAIIEVEANVKMIPDGSILAIARDITERKKVEDAIRVSEETRRLIMNSALDAIVTMDKKGFVTGWNCQAEKLFGWTADEIIGQTLYNTLIPHQYRELHKKGLEKYGKSGAGPVLNKLIEISALDKNGKEFPIELSIIPIKQGENEFFCGFLRDITERKIAEEKIKKEKELSERIIETLPGVFYMIDADGNYIRWNKLKETISKYSHEEMKNMVPLDFFEGKDKENILKAIQEGFRDGSVKIEADIVTKDKQKIPFYFNGVVIDHEGKPCLMGMGIDITEKRKAAEQLLKEKELSDSIINSLPGIFYLINESGKFLRWNKNFEAISGYSSREMNRLQLLDVFDKDEKELMKKKIAIVFEKGMGEAEAHFFTKDRKKIPYYFNGWRIIFENKPCLIGVGIDISDRKQADEKLKQSYQDIRRLASHLEQIREEERIHIAREIHDELGQQLTVLKMDISWLNKKIDKSSAEAQQKISDLLGVIDNTVKTVRRISTELRPSILDDLGLQAALDWQCQEFERRSGIKTSLTSNADHLKLAPVMATGLFRIFQESLTNVARHAQATKVHAQLTMNGNSLMLVIKDNGKGFLTVGIENKKTLGILGMRERALLMDGEFKIISIPGKGTEIRISVPVSNGT